MWERTEIMRIARDNEIGNVHIRFVESDLQITDELIVQRQKALVNLLLSHIKSEEADQANNVKDKGGKNVK
jgi:hypothetical protein